MKFLVGGVETDEYDPRSFYKGDLAGELTVWRVSVDSSPLFADSFGCPGRLDGVQFCVQLCPGRVEDVLVIAVSRCPIEQSALVYQLAVWGIPILEYQTAKTELGEVLHLLTSSVCVCVCVLPPHIWWQGCLELVSWNSQSHIGNLGELLPPHTKITKKGVYCNVSSSCDTHTHR